MQKRIVVGLLCLGMGAFAYANAIDVFLSGGAGFSRLGNKTTITINPSVVNEYDAQETTHIEPFYGIGVGYTFSQLRGRPIDLSLDLAGYYTAFGKVQGIEHPMANSGNFDTLDYQFRGRSYALMVEPRIIYSRYSWQPYVLLGVGTAWNHLYAYSEAPSDPAGEASPIPSWYHNKTMTQTAYEAGLGIQKLFFTDSHGHRYLASLDYRYINFGKGELGGFPAKTAGGAFRVNSLYQQAITFSLKMAF